MTVLENLLLAAQRPDRRAPAAELAGAPPRRAPRSTRNVDEGPGAARLRRRSTALADEPARDPLRRPAQAAGARPRADGRAGDHPARRAGRRRQPGAARHHHRRASLEINRRGITFLDHRAQHGPGRAGSAATVVVMAGGRLLCEGAPDEVARDPRVIEAYLGGAAGMTAPVAARSRIWSPATSPAADRARRQPRGRAAARSSRSSARTAPANRP